MAKSDSSRRSPRRSRPPAVPRRDVAGSILDAAEVLLEEQPLADLTVADVIASAGVSRGSFYFYFESKEAVVAGLLERIIDEVHEASLPWFERGDTNPEAALREAIGGSLALWRRHAPVLRSAVESWQTDEEIRTLWEGVLERFTGAAADRIEADREAGVAPAGVAARALAWALVAMNERCFYLALLESDAMGDKQLVEALTSIWFASLYGPAAARVT